MFSPIITVMIMNDLRKKVKTYYQPKQFLPII